MKKRLDKIIMIWYKYSYSLMIRTESCTGLGGSTQRLHQKEIDMVVLVEYQGEGQNEDPDPTRKGSC